MEMLIFSAVAGIGGMFLGGIISALFLKGSTDKTMCYLLSFASGVMISVVCFSLIAEFFDDYTFHVILGVVLGILAMMILNTIADGIMSKSQQNHNKLFRSGVFMLVAMALHNIPEGIAIGAGGTHDFRLGVVLAIIIALHTIPEGMAVATPLLVSGVKKGMTILLVSLAGATTLLGGALGILIVGISDTAIAMSLSAAGGAMLYVVFGEIIPQAVVMTKSRTVTIVTLLGIIVGLIATMIH